MSAAWPLFTAFKQLINPVPFRHTIIDGMWNPSLLLQCVEETAHMRELNWKHTFLKLGRNFLEVKDSISFDKLAALQHPEDRRKPPIALDRMYQELKDPTFVAHLGDIFRIRDLEFDPLGGGIHRIRPGFALGKHIDFNVNQANGQWRRLNVLVYLTECNGGELCLYDVHGNEIIAVEPVPGRTVIFECNEYSWHGHPTPLVSGPDRLSLAAYYFTREKPSDAAAPHDTIFFEAAKSGAQSFPRFSSTEAPSK